MTNFVLTVAKQLQPGDLVVERGGYLLKVVAVNTQGNRTTLTLKPAMTDAFTQTVNARTRCKKLDIAKGNK
jgi:hypothetical protein